MRYQQTPQQPSQPMPPYTGPQQPMPPMPQYTSPQQPMQYSQPIQPIQQPVPPQTGAQPIITPGGEYTAPLDKDFRKVAGLYFRDTWQMLLGVTGLLLIIFVAVRLATRGYLWGLIFVLLAAIEAELPALRLLPGYLSDLLGKQMTARTGCLHAAVEQSPSLFTRLGLSAKTRYALQDDQGRQFSFTAARGLQQAFGDLEGMEVEIAFLPQSRLMTGIHPVRRTEHLNVYDSARERHLRQVFKEYIPQ